MRFALALRGRWPLAAGYPEPWTGSPVYPDLYRAIAPPPVRPVGFDSDRAAHLALTGPFSLLTCAMSGGFEIDLRHIAGLEPRPPFATAGGVARFIRVNDHTLRTLEIEFEGRRFCPGEPEYMAIERRFLTGLNTHTTLIEHLVNIHLIAAGALAISAVEAFRHDHALRELLQPFLIEVVRINNTYVDGLIREETSNVPQYTGYSLSTVHRTIDLAARRFDLARMDPERRAIIQGTGDQPGFATVQSAIELWHAFRDMVRAYVGACAAEVDEPMRTWVRALDAHVPNGVCRALHIEDPSEVTLEQVAYLVALLAYVSSVGHHIVADLTRDYMLQFDAMPPAVARDGTLPLGPILEKQNSVTIATVTRYRLLDEGMVFSSPAGREVWEQFRARLREVERRTQGETAVIRASRVPSSAHG